MSRIFKFNSFGKPALASLLTGLILFVIAVEASPALHKAIHHDADSSEHSCAITLFAKGQVHSPEPQLFTAIVVLFGGVALIAEIVLLPSADYRFSPSRAPPFFPLN